MSKLYVVGIGPGDYENMTIKADKVLQASDVIVGYSVYVDLVKARYPDKEYAATGMTKETERCRLAIDFAQEGKIVSVICSGDSGIYGMAALIYELMGEKKIPDIEVVPGLTAAASGAAILGAPLTHDFAVISLSDRLTPWEKIEERLVNAARADFSIVIYNPASKGRPEHLKKACEILLAYLPWDRLCGIARNIGREGEERKVITLAELKDYPADMFSTIFIGNKDTKLIGENLVTPRGYKNV